MQAWHGIAVGIVVAALAFQVGYSRGLRDCPAATDAKVMRQAAIDREIAEAMAAPTGRDAVCEQIFDAVIDRLGDEAVDEQAYRAGASLPDRD